MAKSGKNDNYKSKFDWNISNNHNNYIPHLALKHQAPSDVYYGIRHFKKSDSFEIDKLVSNQIIRKTI